MKNKIRGIVIESSVESLVLLTKEGEYIKLPSPGNIYRPGEEIVIKQPKRANKFITAASAAAVLLFLVGVFNFIAPLITPSEPFGYVAIDINPGVLLVLNEETRVETIEAFNSDGEALIGELPLENETAAQAAGKIIQRAYSLGHLPRGTDNAILISLSTLEKEDELKKELNLNLAEQIMQLDTNAYLIVEQAQRNTMEENQQLGISPNAQVLAEEMTTKGFAEEKLTKEPGGPPLPVKELLQKGPPGRIFQEEDLVKSKKPQVEPGPPDDAGPPEDPPMGDKGKGPPEDRKKERPLQDPDKKNGPPETPPGQEKEPGDQAPPGQERKPGDQAPPEHAPGQQEDLPGQAPPGREQEPPGRPENPGRSLPPGR